VDSEGYPSEQIEDREAKHTAIYQKHDLQEDLDYDEAFREAMRDKSDSYLPHDLVDEEMAGVAPKRRMCPLEYADTQNELAERADNAPIADRLLRLNSSFFGRESKRIMAEALEAGK